MIIVPSTFKSSFITKHFFPHNWKSRSFAEINNGDCYTWAYYAYCLFPDVKLYSNDCHAWVCINNRHFDSETECGVLNYRRLKCNVLCNDIGGSQMGIQAYKSYWRYPLHWDRLVEDIYRLGLKPIRT